MANATFSPPKQWEDWANLVLGIWLCLSPWILQLAGDQIVTQNSVLVGLLLILTESASLVSFRMWEEWISVALGAWLVVSPWVLGIPEPAAMANFVIVGLAVAVLALYEIWDVRRHLAHTV
jgi:hypothetical protein